jgi:hypothetical protein
MLIGAYRGHDQGLAGLSQKELILVLEHYRVCEDTYRGNHAF